VRVLMELAAEDLDPYTPGGDAVYDFVRSAADWAGLLPPGGTFSVTSHVWDCSQLNNNVLVRLLREKASGSRPFRMLPHESEAESEVATRE
jgi:hypothetical protein